MCCQSNSIDEVSLADLALELGRMILGDVQVALVLRLEGGIGTLRAFERLIVSIDSQMFRQIISCTSKPTIKAFGNEYGMCETSGVGSHAVGFGLLEF